MKNLTVILRGGCNIVVLAREVDMGCMGWLNSRLGVDWDLAILWLGLLAGRGELGLVGRDGTFAERAALVGALEVGQASAGDINIALVDCLALLAQFVGLEDIFPVGALSAGWADLVE